MNNVIIPGLYTMADIDDTPTLYSIYQHNNMNVNRLSTKAIPRRASIYHHVPIQLDVKNKTGRDLIDISKHKIKMYTIDRRTRSGQ